MALQSCASTDDHPDVRRDDLLSLRLTSMPPLVRILLALHGVGVAIELPTCLTLEMAVDDTNPKDMAKIDVAYVAHLARLHLDEEEIQSLQPQMEAIVDLIKKIDELDVSAVEPTSHASPVTNVFRKDTARDGIERDRILANAPLEVDDQFAVPKIVE
jgi:aspartyl-tRNA(Asn)/glutamyl-tRNA(Gln) amidotransferase subunit C